MHAQNVAGCWRRPFPVERLHADVVHSTDSQVVNQQCVVLTASHKLVAVVPTDNGGRWEFVSVQQAHGERVIQKVAPSSGSWDFLHEQVYIQ